MNIMNDAWIKPNGEIIEVGDAEHNNYASDLLRDEMGFKKMREYMDDNNLDYPYEVLHERGWVRLKISYTGKITIIGDCINLTKFMRNTIDPAMNSTQMIIAKKLCNETNTPFHEAINDKRFW